MRPLAKIGVLGHQIDVADGGDVEPAIGRLLSIAELQQALRAVRRGPLPAGAPVEPAERTRGDATSSRAADPLGSTHRVRDSPKGAGDPGVTDDLEEDPYGWKPDQDDDESRQLPGPGMAGERPRRGRDPFARDPDGKPARKRWAPKKQPRPDARKSRSAAARVTREILGFDRNSTPDDQQWSAPAIADQDASPGDQTAPAVRRTATATGDHDDFEVSAAPRGFVAVCWRWTARMLLVVLLVAGVNQVFVKPFRRSSPAAAAAAVLDPAAAGQAAARWAADYLSYSPSTGVDLAALTGDMAAGANAATMSFSGTGYVRADLAVPGQVTSIDAAHSLVSVTARIHLAVPPPGATPTGTLPATAVGTTGAEPGAAAGDPGPIPTGWIDLGSRWIALVVPVQVAGGVRVSGSGGVFTGESPTVVAPIPGGNPDSGTAAAAQPVAASFFTGYAASDVSYLAQPGVSLTGLGGVVTFVSLANWTVSTPTGVGVQTAAPVTSGVGSGSVRWELAGTDLQVVQRYAMSMSRSQGRWYAAALSPATTDLAD